MPWWGWVLVGVAAGSLITACIAAAWFSKNSPFRNW